VLQELEIQVLEPRSAPVGFTENNRGFAIRRPRIAYFSPTGTPVKFPRWTGKKSMTSHDVLCCGRLKIIAKAIFSNN
jgi:hypothetical protein